MRYNGSNGKIEIAFQKRTFGTRDENLHSKRGLLERGDSDTNILLFFLNSGNKSDY
jgi:hypothetical protein